METEDIKLVWHNSDSNYHATQCMSTVSATGVWGVAPDRVTWIRRAHQHRHKEDEIPEQGG